MIDLIIKYIFLYFNCIYSYHKILNHHQKSYYRLFIHILTFICLILTTTICKLWFPDLLFLFSFSLFWIICNVQEQNSKLSFISCLLSFTFSYGLLSIACFIVVPIFQLIKINYSSYSFFVFTTGILQSFLCIMIFHIKRLRKGMPYLYNSNISNTGTILGIILLSLLTFTQIHSEISLLEKSLVIICITISFFIIIHWWQSQLTKAYRKRLAQLELESLRTELEQKTALLKKLETKNEEMGRLIHKDNKLIPAMEHAVSSYLASAFTDIALQQAQGEALLSDLKEFSEARRGILSTFAPISAPKYNTGIPSLDAILVYMYQKAQVQDIRFYAAATPESIAALPPALTTKKLVHMLSDLLENAIIATKTSTEKQIQVQIYLANGLFTIEVADTGCSFEPATLISFGLEKASTHLTEGGSGIGLLDIWKIKEETKASIHIHEYEAGAPFSKKLFITFDKKNKYVIHTWRDKELSPLVNRGDIVILPQEQM